MKCTYIIISCLKHNFTYDKTSQHSGKASLHLYIYIYVYILRWWFHGPWHTNMGMSCDVQHNGKDKLMVFDLGSILSAACKLSFSFMANLPLPIWGLIKTGLDFADHGLVKKTLAQSCAFGDD